MLELKNIKKDYPAGSETVHALKGVSLRFRDSEFVSILGPSGCGKTTMLNLIGGLDQYTDGDLVINGVSTKHFRDRDWDAYRNHSVGFVFQSYNLIPHQTVLQNVELALTLSGVSKSERRRRAKEALEAVGLGDQLKKRPGEMSGGQMQRVAIARAIVNDPDIVLADEPTGALDSETSVQVMDILKKISENRLVIMVTHNPDLAEKYSTRIVRMLDGEITDDSAPPSDEEVAVKTEAASEATAKPAKKKAKKPSMSLMTAFGLSLKNLFTKKGRTILTAFAGSIGIIGIALIYAVSNGMTSYIDYVQEETLSSYPLTLEAQHMDIGTLMATFIESAESAGDHASDAVYEKPVLQDLVNALNKVGEHKNDLKAFKEYLETERRDPNSTSGLREAVSGVQYTYNMDVLIYTKTEDGVIRESNAQKLITEMLMEYPDLMPDIMKADAEQSAGMMSMMSENGMMPSTWQEMLPGTNGEVISPLVTGQYELVEGGRWPTAYNEIVLVLDENNEIDDMTLYALGLISEEEIQSLIQKVLNKEPLPDSNRKWTYEEIYDMEFRTILSADCYKWNEATGTYVDVRQLTAVGDGLSNIELEMLYDNGISLKVTGIVRPAEETMQGMLKSSIAYTSKLTEYVVLESRHSPALKAQLATPDVDIFTGLPFASTDKELTEAVKLQREKAFREYVASLDVAGKAEAYLRILSIPTPEEIDAEVSKQMQATDRAAREAMLVQMILQTGPASENEVATFVANRSEDDLSAYFAQAITAQVAAVKAAQVQQTFADTPAEALAQQLDAAMLQYDTETCASLYSVVLDFSDATLEDNLEKLGYVDLDEPATINLYAATFEDKDVIEAAIQKYNDSVDEISRIGYTDYVGLMMSSVTTIINAITYVLIAFVSVSLIVSSIMIGVITLISVQERTKEIGILRAIGASKRNVSNMFNAETVIIGFASGALGVLVTYLLCIPINLILNTLTGIPNLDAALPWQVAVILIAISVFLTLFAGIIPSRSAARKDPVVALRTE